MAITISIPFYSGQHFLRDAIDSIVVQTSSEWRMVVVDDAGPDSETEELVASYGDPRMRYVRNERNRGLAGNWNRCVEVAETDLVTLLHYDDRLLPDYVERMLSVAAENPGVATLHCRTVIIDHSGRRTFSPVDASKQLLMPRGRDHVLLEGSQGVNALMRGNFIMCPTTCYRRPLLPPGPFDDRWKMVMDLDLYTRLLFAGARLLVVRDVLYAYRRHDANATELYTESMLRFREEAELHDEIAEEARRRGWADAARTASRKRIIKLNLLFRIAQDALHLRFTNARRKARFLGSLSRRRWRGPSAC